MINLNKRSHKRFYCNRLSCWFAIGLFVLQFVDSYAAGVSDSTPDQVRKTKTNKGAVTCIAYRDDSADLKPLIDSVRVSGTSILDTCLAQGLDLRTTTDLGETLLHVAASWGQIDAVRWLIEHGAPINAVDHIGQTPLMMAIIARDPEMVHVLLDANADIFIHRIESGETARQLALDEARFDKNFEQKWKMGPIASLLESLGSREYLGSKLPASTFDSELEGKDQIEVTGGVYGQLTFVRPNYRFFAVVEHTETMQDEGTVQGGQYPPRQIAVLFAVLPDYSVVKLAAASDFSKLGIQLRSEADALAFVQALTNSTISNSVSVRFSDLDLQEMPMEIEPGSCLSVAPEPIKAAGLSKPTVDTVFDNGHHKIFVVTRYMIPFAMHLDLESLGQHAIDHVTRVVERVELNGTYTMTTEDVPTPGLVAKYSCVLL